VCVCEREREGERQIECVHLGGRVEHMDVNNDGSVSGRTLLRCVYACMCVRERATERECVCVHLGGRVEHMEVNDDGRVSREEFAWVCVCVYLYVCVCVCKRERGCVCVCVCIWEGGLSTWMSTTMEGCPGRSLLRCV